MPSVFPDQTTSYPVMVVLIRNGVEVAADDAPDSFQAVKVAARLILAQDSLHVGDQLVIARV